MVSRQRDPAYSHLIFPDWFLKCILHGDALEDHSESATNLIQNAVVYCIIIDVPQYAYLILLLHYFH